MRQAAITVILLILFAGTAIAGAFEDAVVAHQRGNYEAAMKLYTIAAEDGNAYAQYNLGFMHANGHGVPQDYAEAMWWYRWAADQGHAGAQYNLGVMYDIGQGVQQDYLEAVKWYQAAGGEGIVEALLNLAYMYANGQGVEQNYVQAYMYFNLVLSQGVKGASVRHNRDAMAKNMTPAQIDQAAKLALEWKPH